MRTLLLLALAALPIVQGGGDACPSALIITRGKVLPEKWVHGAEGEPELQAHALFEDEDTGAATWVLRFSKWQGTMHADDVAYEDAYEGNCSESKFESEPSGSSVAASCRLEWLTSFPMAVVFLFIGEQTVALFDTGPVANSSLRIAVEYLVGDASSQKDLIVAHTHSHGDHVAGDGLWPADAPPAPFRSVQHVGHAPSEVWGFFGVTIELPPARFALGSGRDLQLFPIPGHEPSAIAIYDKASHSLFTGDNLGPFRLCDAAHDIPIPLLRAALYKLYCPVHNRLSALAR